MATEPEIPRWDEIEKLLTFEQQLAFIKANPDIRNGIIPAEIGVLPQIRILFNPSYQQGWGLTITVSAIGITALPFGEIGKTGPATQFVLDTAGRTALLAKISCELAYLAAKYVSKDFQRPPPPPKDVTEKLFRRIQRQEKIELIAPDSTTSPHKPEHAIKNLLIEYLSRPEHQ